MYRHYQPIRKAVAMAKKKKEFHYRGYTFAYPNEKTIEKLTAQAVKINDDPEYIDAYIRYKTMAKTADQRLVRIEALAHEEHFKGVKEFAYKDAIHDIRQWGGGKRFNVAPPADLKELEAKNADIEKFLHKVTSNKADIVTMYKKKADSLNSHYGTNLTWKEVATLFETIEAGDLDKDSDKYTSGSLVKAIEVLKVASDDKMIQKANKEADMKLIKDIQDINERVKFVPHDKVVDIAVQELLKQGIDYNTIMKGK